MTILSTSHRRQPSGSILPPDPVFARWYERINGGARFRLDFGDEVLGADGEPYLRLPLVPEGDDGYTFGEVALFLYNRMFGALLTQPDGDAEHDSSHLEVSLGDVTDYLHTGLMLDRVPCTPPWGYPGSQPADFFSGGALNGALLKPEMAYLSQAARASLNWLFEQVGVADVRVSLFDGNNGQRCLWVVYQIEQQLSADQYRSIARRVFWCLPRHYAVMVTPMSNNIETYPLFPLFPE